MTHTSSHAYLLIIKSCLIHQIFVLLNIRTRANEKHWNSIRSVIHHQEVRSSEKQQSPANTVIWSTSFPRNDSCWSRMPAPEHTLHHSVLEVASRAVSHAPNLSTCLLPMP